jgi:NAD(P)-dependent dehydrogenase (short-subunit alcohol dehydrogenase family)
MSEQPPRFFENKVAVVIGGASGIGAALCRLLAQEGARVIVADLDFPRAKELARELGGPAKAFEVDIATGESVRALIENSVAGQGAIHLLINSAGVLVQGDAEDLTDADWSRVLHVNMHGAVTATMAAYRVMVDQGFGHIVNISSLSGLNPPPFSLPYVTSKYAVVGLSIALRAEAKPHGVKVSVVCPGNVATPMISALAHQPSRLTPTISSQHAAKEILRGIRLNRPVIVFPAYARVFWLLERIAPWLSSALRGLIVTKAVRRNAAAKPAKPLS